ncbi:hypothetical protein JTE90_021756 [Oedothorax gibbosus]|uniref:DEP domain-containing protein n=1 Tax=Oedothorax gibbosus TaxID=931172 RepID=A0AAV6TYE5_9ARAC|nr:hypothetical protein JTE90_021756 [Oedothorax gibbosus]
MQNNEPYRATRLWNEVISAFQSGMPLKKHRRRIQTFNSCFTASDAVTWLHCYLLNNANFGSDVTRQQTVNLLQKFLKCHVIESVVVRSKKKEFSDDSHLYRFTSISSQVSKPSALCLLQSPSFGVRNINRERTKVNPVKVRKPSVHIQKENLPECHFVERKLTADEEKLMWRKVTLGRVEKLMPFPSFIDILDEKDVDGLVIKHNVSRLSKTGVVCLVDKTDDIPHWVISAMKCLANWPNASGSGSCLPNYPGFEKDVFKVVRDFFVNPQVPLLPPFLTPLLIKVFCYFTDNEYIDFNKAATTPLSQKTSSNKSSTLSTSTSSNLITSTPVGNTDYFIAKQTSRSSRESSQAKLLLDDPEVMWDYPSAVIYETDFGTTNPVTRVISNQSSPKSRSCANSVGSIESVSTISICSRQSQRSEIIEEGVAKSPLKSWCSNLYLQDEVKESWHKSPRSFAQPEIAGSSTSLKSNLSHHSNVYLCEINDLDTSNLSSKTVTEESESSKRYSRQGLYYSSSAIHSEGNSGRDQHSTYGSVKKDLMKNNNYSEDLKTAFQLILLIMPSANRRQLHLLLRLLSKVLKNGQFVLDVKVPMRDYLLDTFLPAIVQSDQKHLLLLEMTSFLLDNCEMIFQVPQGLKQEVQDLSRISFGRIRYCVDDPLTYCELVSRQQYEEQKASVSNEALLGLLRSILQDPDISDKERRRKMKLFKESHPEVYHLQFPERQGPPPRSKQTLLNRLVNLRILDILKEKYSFNYCLFLAKHK